MQTHYDGPCHIQNKIEVSRACETHSLMPRMHLRGFGQEVSTVLSFPYTIFFHVYIYTHTHTHSDMILTSPLQILHSEVLYSTQQFRDSRKRSLCFHSKYIVGGHSNLVSEFHQAAPCVCLQQSTQIVPDPLQTV